MSSIVEINDFLSTSFLCLAFLILLDCELVVDSFSKLSFLTEEMFKLLIFGVLSPITSFDVDIFDKFTTVSLSLIFSSTFSLIKFLSSVFSSSFFLHKVFFIGPQISQHHF